MIDLQSLDDAAFADLRERVDVEYDRREDAKLADQVAAIPIEVCPVYLRRERIHAGQSLKVRQYDYVHGVSVTLHGHTVGSFYLASGHYWFGNGYAPEAFSGRGYCGYDTLTDLVRQCWRYQIPHYPDRVIRLLAARIHLEIVEICSAISADGSPIAWTGYEDGTPVPPADVKGRPR